MVQYLAVIVAIALAVPAISLAGSRETATAEARATFQELNSGHLSPGRWKTIEADNGAVYQVDLKSIQRYNTGAVDVIVYAIENHAYNPRRLFLDCQGRYRDDTMGGAHDDRYAPPRSVAGRVAEVACAR